MTTASLRPALLLNADFRPISLYPLSLVDWTDSVKDVLNGRLITVETYDTAIRSQGSETRPPVVMRLPSVVALKSYHRMDRPAAFTRMAVMLRDRKTCAYCGERFPTNQLTFDHVIPRAKGGKHRFDNVVAACQPCNGAKGDKLLDECGMKLLQKPYVPTLHQLNEVAREFPPPAENLHDTWLPYLGIDPATAAAKAKVSSGSVSGGAFPPNMTSDEYWHVELETE